MNLFHLLGHFGVGRHRECILNELLFVDVAVIVAAKLLDEFALLVNKLTHVVFLNLPFSLLNRVDLYMALVEFADILPDFVDLTEECVHHIVH